MIQDIDLIFYSKNNFSLGEKIRECLRNINKDVVYSNNFPQIIERIKNEKQVIVFVDKGYRQYVKMLSGLINSSLECVDCVRLVFIDDDLAFYADFINNEKFFCIPTTNLKISLQNIVFACEMLNYRKESINSTLLNLNETISKYLVDAGFSYKLNGFRYIKQAVEIGVKNNFSLGSLQKDIYPVVASQNNTRSFNIERGIRMAIKTAAKSEKFKKELNISSSNEVSNRSFLIYLLDKVNSEQCV